MSVVACAFSLTACTQVIFEDEGDCTPHYKVRFVFDLNMKYADAFDKEVDEVSLWLLDSEGSIVWSKTENVSSLEDGNTMDVDVPAGTYGIIAWCRGENIAPSGPKGDFTLSGGDRLSVRDDLGCIIDHVAGQEGHATSDQDLHRLYHGAIQSFTFPDKEGEHVAVVNLTKDTNVIRVMLQQMEGSVIDPDIYNFNIYDNNIVMDCYNNIVAGHPVTYGAWSKVGASASIPASVTMKATAGVNCVVAELTTGRLMESNTSILHVTRQDGSTVLRIPLVRYALLVKGMYNSRMTDQEYLDRKDEYNLTFFLDERGRWISTVVQIEAWRIVENSIE